MSVLLDRRQAAAAIGCTEQALRKYIADGLIPEVEIGRLHRIPASEIDRLIAEARTAAERANRSKRRGATAGAHASEVT